jgi:hypothetical protein
LRSTSNRHRFSMIDGVPREDRVGPQENIRQSKRLADYVIDRRLVVISSAIISATPVAIMMGQFPFQHDRSGLKEGWLSGRGRHRG